MKSTNTSFLLAVGCFLALMCCQPRSGSKRDSASPGDGNTQLTSHRIGTGSDPAPSCVVEEQPATPRLENDPPAVWPSKTYYRGAEIDGVKIFYREAGDPSSPTIVLLHGYPSSSHTYRELIPLLSGRYHVVAPDYVGSGFSEHLDPEKVTYTFDLLAHHVTGLIEHLGLEAYVLYMQDFGAPVGFRVAMSATDRLRGLIVQNGNAYLDGLTEQRRAFFRSAHEDRSAKKRKELDQFAQESAIKNLQYLRDVPGQKSERMSPDSWTHDLARMPSDRDRAIQVQLFQDYQTNIESYPRWQQFLREHQPPTLVIWGEHDPAFIAEGGRAYARDLPHAEIHMLDAGHFAVEEQPVEAAKYIIRFMESLPATGKQSTSNKEARQ